MAAVQMSVPAARRENAPTAMRTGFFTHGTHGSAEFIAMRTGFFTTAVARGMPPVAGQSDSRRLYPSVVWT